MISTENSEQSRDLTLDIIGVWSLLSREDYTSDGRQLIDPALGERPLGILTYAPTHFAAQFMKRDRTEIADMAVGQQGKNNTGAVGGYDAYFGTYQVNDESGEVLHRLEGALTADNVGLEVSRKLQVDGDHLVIQLDTTSTAGEPISRTLTWRRIG